MRYRNLIVPTHFCGEGTIYSHGFFYSVNFERRIYSSYKVVRGINRKPAQCSIYNFKTKRLWLNYLINFLIKTVAEIFKIKPLFRKNDTNKLLLSTLFKFAGSTRLETDDTIFFNFKEYFNNYAKSIIYFCY